MTRQLLVLLNCLLLVAATPPCEEPIYNCFVDPCTVTVCPAFPSATCISNYCGGCNAQFFDGDSEVTALCNSVTTVTTTATTTTGTPPLRGCRTTDGRLVPNGSSFLSSDGCNTCFCTDGNIGCTERACISPTTPPPTPPPTTIPPATPNCGLILCDWPICPDNAQPITLPGHCCPSCPATPTPPDCSVVRCALPLCVGGVTPVIPVGQCCPQCPTANPTPTPAVVRPVPLHALLCPNASLSTCSPAAAVCSSDGDCSDDELCCSSACGGRRCTGPDVIPYYSIPLQCPAMRMQDTCGTPSQPPCEENSMCGANQLCCQHGNCGRYCTAGVASTQPCLAVRELFSSIGGLPGAFIPACQDDGSFSAAQFFGSTGYSWCVDVHTGYPVSPFYPRGSPAQCSSVCVVGDIAYRVGQEFPSSDGCNTCECLADGRVACTEIACNICSLPPVSGLCLAAFQAFYYDQDSQTCRQFIYGGCGGNGNNFPSVQECLAACSPPPTSLSPPTSSDPCLQTKQVGDCDGVFPSFFFNGTSGTCERFNYGGCGGNDNRFSSREDCLRVCSPNINSKPCELGELLIQHQQRYTDLCSSCVCTNGRMRCIWNKAEECFEAETTVTMKFNGDYDMLIRFEDTLRRITKQTFLSNYKEDLNLEEEQIQDIQFSRGSIVVAVLLRPTATGANLTVLSSQLKQDYMSGLLVISYDGMVLEPTGEFSTSFSISSTDNISDTANGLVWWHYLIIAASGVLLVASCLTAIIVVAVVVSMKKKKRVPYQEALKDDCEVSYKKNESEIFFE